MPIYKILLYPVPVLIVLSVTLLLVPVFKRFAPRLGLIDIPSSQPPPTQHSALLSRHWDRKAVEWDLHLFISLHDFND